jgi:hypothetical protein
MEIPMPASNTLFRGVALVALASAAALGAPAAHAQWKVNDTDANKVLGTAKKGSTINSNLYDVNGKLDITKLSKDNKWVGERVKDPSSTFPKSDSTEATLDDGSRCKSVAQDQQDTCKKIVDIENAQYKFMVSMYETSKTRDTTLRDILDERIKLGTSDYGKLEDNTNKLTALYALIQLDRQQMESVNYAYEANLRYLRYQQTQSTTSAQKGSNKDTYGSINIPGVGNYDVGTIIQDVIGGAVLVGALETAKSSKPDGMQTLKVTEGF